MNAEYREKLLAVLAKLDQLVTDADAVLARGGNSIRLVGGENLHSRWDGLLGRRDLLRDVDREVGEMSDRVKYGNEWNTAKRETDVRKWVAESHELCKSVAYSAEILKAVRDTPPGADVAPIRLTESYMRDAGTLARRRIVAAGLRLAAILDQTPTIGRASPVPRYPSHPHFARSNDIQSIVIMACDCWFRLLLTPVQRPNVTLLEPGTGEPP